MLSAESAAGDWPVESVTMMNAIGNAVERDPMHGDRIHFTVMRPDPTTADALSEAAKQIARTVSAVAIICFTTSGSTARRIARERPAVPILVLTPKLETARRLGLLWGTHAVHTRDVESFEEMVAKAKRTALRQGIAKAGDRVVVMAGVPFRTPGSTNVIHVVGIIGDELKNYTGSAANA
jgi:pyruvate kinase